MHSHLPTIEPCKWLWSSRCTLKIKVFAWLLFFDRLNTKDMLVRRHWRAVEDDNLCVYATSTHMRIVCTCSLLVTLVPEFGTIFRLTGLEALMFNNASLWLGRDLPKASSLRWFSQLLGIYGFSGMARPSEGKSYF